MKILFMCIANSARSQLAEGLAQQVFPDAMIESAGSNPGKLNSFAVQAMNEIGIDISKHYSKSCEQLSPAFIEGLDYIITLCAEEVCPTIFSKTAKRIHWPFPDPASKETLTDTENLNRFRTARDGILKKLKSFKAEIENAK